MLLSLHRSSNVVPCHQVGAGEAPPYVRHVNPGHSSDPFLSSKFKQVVHSCPVPIMMRGGRK